MSKYTDAVAHNLKGCEAISTGLCPGCDECRAGFDNYKVQENTGDDDELYWYFLADDTKQFTTEELAEAAAKQAFEDDYHNGTLSSEASFSWRECGICGSRLGGDREDWHYVAKNSKGIDTIYHHDDACVDCVIYLANGEEPESWGDDDSEEDSEPEPTEDPPDDPPDKPTNSLDIDTLDEFTRAYLECALWSSNDESTPQGGEPFDENYSLDNIHPQSIAQAIKVCADFQAAHQSDLDTCLTSGPDWGPMGHGGHDLWLTRNGHGAGYWDGDYPQDAGERLSKAARDLGECCPYFGDGGWVYLDLLPQTPAVE